MDYLGLFSYSVTALAYFVLSLLLCTSLRGRSLGGLLLVATATTTIWAISVVWVNWHERWFLVDSLPIELLRSFVWLWFLSRLLAFTELQSRKLFRYGKSIVLITGLILFCYELSPELQLWTQVYSQADWRIIGHLGVSIIGLFLLEQLYRNTQVSKRWAVKHIYLGLAATFAFDFILYAEALLYSHINLALWNARGWVLAFVVPLIGLSSARNPNWALEVFVSRRIIYSTSVLVITGLYLLLMAIAGFYIRDFGGQWSEVLLAVFITLATVSLLVLLLSAQVRSKFKVLVNKHFFHFKYDYRDEWLRLNNALVSNEPAEPLQQRCIRVMADTVDSPAGVLWQKNRKGVYRPVFAWNLPLPEDCYETLQGELIPFLLQKRWVINKHEYDDNKSLYDGIVLPEWFTQQTTHWLIVPLINHDDLYGFIVLSQPRAPRTVNWEDHDLLKMIGYQLTNYLALVDASEELANARQFEAYNRLSAFIVHDLKNLVAQLSLIVTNADKHKRNPEFIDDAIDTLSNAVAKMNRLLEQLRKGKVSGSAKALVDLNDLAAAAVKQQSNNQPAITLESASQPLKAVLDGEKMVSVLGHLLQNAQDATENTGWIRLRLTQDQHEAVISIADNGCGMDQAFIRDRLFKPFDTTKGNAGMGIGVFDSKAFVEGLNGSMNVTSVPGEGTEFILRLPLHLDQQEAGTKNMEDEQACQV